MHCQKTLIYSDKVSSHLTKCHLINLELTLTEINPGFWYGVYSSFIIYIFMLGLCIFLLVYSSIIVFDRLLWYLLHFVYNLSLIYQIIQNKIKVSWYKLIFKKRYSGNNSLKSYLNKTFDIDWTKNKQNDITNTFIQMENCINSRQNANDEME